jgi:hypothetical protein
MKGFSCPSGMWSVLVFILFVIVLAGIAIPNFVREPRTGPGNHILNRLRDIERAKEQWRVDHPGARPATLAEQDLAPYLSRDFWKQTVAGESYLIHNLDEPPEAVMSKDVDWIPKGMKVRFGPDPDGKVEVRPNHQRIERTGARG